MEIWNKELPLSDIKDIANCKIPSTMKSNHVVSWLSDKWENHNVGISETSLEDLCKPDLLLNQLVWPAKIEHNIFKDMCDILQGKVSHETLGLFSFLEFLVTRPFFIYTFLGHYPIKRSSCCYVIVSVMEQDKEGGVNMFARCVPNSFKGVEKLRIYQHFAVSFQG